MAAPGYGYGIVAMVAPGYGGPWCVYVCMHVCNKINIWFDTEKYSPSPSFLFFTPPQLFPAGICFHQSREGEGKGDEPPPPIYIFCYATEL